jgi:hypothetical protein
MFGHGCLGVVVDGLVDEDEDDVEGTVVLGLPPVAALAAA